MSTERELLLVLRYPPSRNIGGTLTFPALELLPIKAGRWIALAHRVPAVLADVQVISRHQVTGHEMPAPITEPRVRLSSHRPARFLQRHGEAPRSSPRRGSRTRAGHARSRHRRHTRFS
jgi:hypothetical protein